jgi:RNA polymerase sigma-70 factor, ECF subfamily
MALRFSRDASPPNTMSASPHSDATTRSLLLEIEARPDLGWEALVRRVESQLRVLAHFRTASSARGTCEVDDLLQEVWVEAVRNFDRFEYRGTGSLQRWLAGILRMKAMHAGRAVPRLPAPLSQKRGRTAPPGLREHLERTATGASHDARQREVEAKVKKALASLPEAEREVILSKLYEGLTGREIAARLGVDESTVSLRFKRGLERCARELRGFAP